MPGCEEKQTAQEFGLISSKRSQSKQFQWALTQVKNNVSDEYESDFVEESSNDSCDSLMMLSSSEMMDDATSSSSSVLSHDGPLYELSELMAELPIKRGLSKYYQGKSESFGSFANLKSIENLAKCGSHRSRKSTKSQFRSFGGGQSQILSPKGIIVKNKKSSSPSIAKGSLLSSLGEISSFLDIISLQNPI